MGKVAPVNPLGKWVVVELAHFVEVHELMSTPDQFESRIGIEDRFQADPGWYIRLMELADRINAVEGKCSTRLPLTAVVRGEKRQGGSECVSFSKQIQVSERPTTAFGEDLNGDAVGVENLDSLSGDLMDNVESLVGVTGEREQYPLVSDEPGCLAFQFIQESFTEFGDAEVIAFYPYDVRRVAVNTPVVTTGVDVEGQGCILPGPSSWFID